MTLRPVLLPPVLVACALLLALPAGAATVTLPGLDAVGVGDAVQAPQAFPAAGKAACPDVCRLDLGSAPARNRVSIGGLRGALALPRALPGRVGTPALPGRVTEAGKSSSVAGPAMLWAAATGAETADPTALGSALLPGLLGAQSWGGFSGGLGVTVPAVAAPVAALLAAAPVRVPVAEATRVPLGGTAVPLGIGLAALAGVSARRRRRASDEA